MKANWFAAFPMPTTDWFGPLVQTCPTTCRPFAAGDLHLTLAFFGGLEAAEVTRVCDHLATLRLPLLPFRFDHALLLPQPKRFSAVCLGLGEGRAEIAAQMARHRDPLLATAGKTPDPRPPLPHVTLARPIRKHKQVAQQEGAAWCHALGIPDISLTLDEIALYTWSDQRPVRQFRIVARFPLGANPD